MRGPSRTNRTGPGNHASLPGATRCCVFLAFLLPLYAIACGPHLVWYGRSPDRRRSIRVLETRGKQYVVEDGRKGPDFDGIAVEGIAFSPDGRHVAYPAQRGEKWFVVLDGREGAAWDGIGEVVFCPERSALVYSAVRNKRWFVVGETTTWGPFASLVQNSLVFSRDGRHVAFAVQQEDHVRAVLDGTAGKEYDGLRRAVFDADGTCMAYVARRGDFQMVVLNGVEGPPFEVITELVFAPFGKGVAYLAQAAGRWHVVRDGVPGPAREGVYNLLFGPDGRSLACIVRRGAEEVVFRDGHEGPRFDGIKTGSLVFSSQGDRLAYIGRTARGERLVLDGEAGPEFDTVEEIVFGPGGSRWGFVATRSRDWLMFLNGVEVGKYDWAGNLVFGRGEGRHAYLAREGETTRVMHDRGSREYDLVVAQTLAFLPDENRWCCLAGDRGDQELFVSVEGQSKRGVFDWEELTAQLMRGSSSLEAGLSGAGVEWMRRCVLAEARNMVKGKPSMERKGK